MPLPAQSSVTPPVDSTNLTLQPFGTNLQLVDDDMIHLLVAILNVLTTLQLDTLMIVQTKPGTDFFQRRE